MTPTSPRSPTSTTSTWLSTGWRCLTLASTQSSTTGWTKGLGPTLIWYFSVFPAILNEPLPIGRVMKGFYWFYWINNNSSGGLWMILLQRTVWPESHGPRVAQQGITDSCIGNMELVTGAKLSQPSLSGQLGSDSQSLLIWQTRRLGLVVGHSHTEVCQCHCTDQSPSVPTARHRDKAWSNR